MATGPLNGVRIIELAGIGPGPFAAMLLSDMGADVIRVDRSSAVVEGHPGPPPWDPLNRGRRSIGVDLKNPDGVETVLRLIETADALIEGFRPGVTERMGLGPDVCLARNPKLVYGRMTGWGQDGPYANAAGHDINYIALAGALHPVGRAGGPPVPPLNFAGDFGGGAMFLAVGILCALLESKTSGQGQVVDAAMVDGAAVLTNLFHGLKAIGMQTAERGTNIIDSGSHFYDAYECADGEYISVGSVEPQFYAELLRLTGLEADEELGDQTNRDNWPRLKEKVAARFKEKTRAEWCALMEYSDACFAPVLSLWEAPKHPANVERNVFIEVGGIEQANAAPRFSRTPSAVQGPPAHPGEHTDDVLIGAGFSADEVAKLRDTGAVR